MRGWVGVFFYSTLGVGNKFEVRKGGGVRYQYYGGTLLPSTCNINDVSMQHSNVNI